MSRPSSPREPNSSMELSIGNVDGLDPQISAPPLSHELGNFDELADFDNHKSQLGDLAILDEAISDMGAGGSGTRIPTLVESVSHATAIHEAIQASKEKKLSAAAASESDIPLLNEIASEFKRGTPPLVAEDDAIAAALRDLEGGGNANQGKPESKPVEAATNDEQPFLMDILSPPTSLARSQPSKMHSRTSALEIPPSEPESLEDLIPQANTALSLSRPENDGSRSHSFESDILAALEDRGELSHDAVLEQAAARERTSSTSEFHFALPEELHAQLAQKIDQLVVETTTSITNAFSKELNNRLEDILGQAVQTTMANFADSLAENLRTEVKHRVKSQIPDIINDVLGRTKLDQ